jgi:hypothetical protein
MFWVSSSLGRWVAKLVPVAGLLAAAALWVRIQAPLTNKKKWATVAKEWTAHSSSPKSQIKVWYLCF